MLNRLMIKLLDTYSHIHTVLYNRVNNVTIKVMSSKQINRIRLPTGKVEEEVVNILILAAPERICRVK